MASSKINTSLSSTEINPRGNEQAAKSVTPHLPFEEAATLYMRLCQIDMAPGAVYSVQYVRTNTLIAYQRNIDSLALFFTGTKLCDIDEGSWRAYQIARANGHLPFVRYRRPQYAKPRTVNGTLIPAKGKTPLPGQRCPGQSGTHDVAPHHGRSGRVDEGTAAFLRAPQAPRGTVRNTTCAHTRRTGALAARYAVQGAMLEQSTGIPSWLSIPPAQPTNYGHSGSATSTCITRLFPSRGRGPNARPGIAPSPSRTLIVCGHWRIFYFAPRSWAAHIRSTIFSRFSIPKPRHTIPRYG